MTSIIQFKRFTSKKTNLKKSFSNFYITCNDFKKHVVMSKTELFETLNQLNHCIAKWFKVSAHWVRNFRTLKNKYDLTLCQSRLHTASETFVHQKQFGSGSIFCVFASVACILIGKYNKIRKFRTQCAMAFTVSKHSNQITNL